MPTILPVLGLILTIWAAIGIKDLRFNMDARATRAINPVNEEIVRQKSGSTEGLALSPAVVLADNEAHGQRVYDTLRKAFNDQAHFDGIEQVVGLQTLIPKNQKEKLEMIAEIRALLRKKRDFVDNERDQKRVDSLYRHTDIHAINKSDIPEDFVRLFREKARPLTYDVHPWAPHKIPWSLLDWIEGMDTRVSGTVFYIFPRKDMWNLWHALEYSEQLGRLRVDGEPLLINSGHIVFAELVRLVQSDGIWASTLSFYCVFVLVLLSFAYLAGRRKKLVWLFLTSAPVPFLAFLVKEGVLLDQVPFTTIFACGALFAFMVMILVDRRSVWQALIVSSPLITSFLMLLAIMPLVGWSVNFFNMLFFPAMLGIGIDSSIHVYHRYLEEGDDALESIVGHTGAAIGMATLTTAIGFGGMIMASHLGLRSLGILAICGLGITFINAALIFPSLLRILHHRGWLPVKPGSNRPQG
jgi:hypothetical protein